MKQCSDYKAGTKMGRSRAVCQHYLDNGACKHPKHFMCELWILQQNGYIKSRGELAIKCSLDGVWKLREDCKECPELDKTCGV